MPKIKRLSLMQLDDAAALANKACIADVLDAYTQEGKENMVRYMAQKADVLASQVEKGIRVVYGLFEEDKMVAMMAIQNKNHIALLYVNKKHRKKGYGKMLISFAKGYATAFHKPLLTVDASDYGLVFYQKCGFVATGFRQINDGITYTPMKLTL